MRLTAWTRTCCHPGGESMLRRHSRPLNHLEVLGQLSWKAGNSRPPSEPGRTCGFTRGAELGPHVRDGGDGTGTPAPTVLALPRDARGWPDVGGAEPCPCLHWTQPALGHRGKPDMSQTGRGLVTEGDSLNLGQRTLEQLRPSADGEAPQGWRELVRDQTEKVSPE